MPNAELLQTVFWARIFCVDIFCSGGHCFLVCVYPGLISHCKHHWLNVLHFNIQNVFAVASHQPHQREAQAMLKAAGHSEKSHCGCLSSLQRLHFMTEIKHLACAKIAFENYALMIATQASSLVISLWPLSRASQFGHFSNKYLGAYHVLRGELSGGYSDE